VLTAAVLLGACSDDDGDADGEPEGTLISLVPSGEIEVSLDEVAAPDSFPADVPLPADVELEQFDELVGATTIYDITGWHPGTPVPLGEAYLTELRAAGFDITSRSDATDSILFVVTGDEWFVSAGFYPDPVRNTGTSIGVTVGPASSAPVTD
jgi:hypothetical protein